jgi:hypothetical protein
MLSSLDPLTTVSKRFALFALFTSLGGTMAESQLPSVVMLDFLNEADVEAQVLAGVGKVHCLNASKNADLSPAQVRSQ